MAGTVYADSGVAVFPLPAVGQPGTHRFEIVGTSGAAFPGRPAVTLVVRAGEPGRLRVAPDYVATVESGVTIVATVTDSLGNPSIDVLAQMLRTNRAQLAARQRYLEMVSLDPGESAVLITLKAQRLGTFDFTVGSGITASVRVDAMAR